MACSHNQPVIGWHITIKIIVCLLLADTVCVCHLFYSPTSPGRSLDTVHIHWTCSVATWIVGVAGTNFPSHIVIKIKSVALKCVVSWSFSDSHRCIKLLSTMKLGPGPGRLQYNYLNHLSFDSILLNPPTHNIYCCMRAFSMLEASVNLPSLKACPWLMWCATGRHWPSQ